MKKLLLVLILMFVCVRAEATNYCTSAIACYKFESGSGTTAIDSSGNSRDGTFSSGGHPAWYNSSTVGSWSQWSVDFTPQDYIEIPSMGIFGGASNFSIIASVYPDSTGSTDAFIWHPRSERDINLRIFAGTTPSFGYYNAGDFRVTDTVAISNAAWTNVCGVWDKTGDNKMYLYVNGSSKGTPITPGIPASVADKSTIGTQYYSGAGHLGFNGRIDDFAIFNIALNSTQINDIKDNGLSPSASTPIGSTLGDGTGTQNVFRDIYFN